MTRSFSGSWTRKKRCLQREATLRLPVCQYSFRFEQVPVDSLLERKDTHEKQYVGSQSGTRRGSGDHGSLVRQAGSKGAGRSPPGKVWQSGREGRRLSRDDRRQPHHASKWQESDRGIRRTVGRPQPEVTLHGDCFKRRRPRAGTALRRQSTGFCSLRVREAPVNFPDPMRGELSPMAASWIVLLSGEL